MTAQDEKDRRHARIDALTGDQRLFLLDFLVGYAPEAADAALDDLEGRTAAQAAEGSNG